MHIWRSSLSITTPFTIPILLNQLQQYSFPTAGNVLCIYGDPAYPLRPHLQSPFKGSHLTPLQNDWNKSVSAARASAEWVFGDIINYFKFLDFKKSSTWCSWQNVPSLCTSSKGQIMSLWFKYITIFQHSSSKYQSIFYLMQQKLNLFIYVFLVR